MIDLPPISAPVKRSVTINGHRTSVSLEDAFWSALKRAADSRRMTRAALISQVDHRRPPDVGLATALRLFALSEAGREAAPEPLDPPN